MKSAEELCIEYYENREDLKVINQEIKELSEKEVTLDCYRDGHYKGADGPLEIGIKSWKGWVHALIESEDSYSANEMRLATLLDIKKKIIKEKGKMTRSIWARGKKLRKEGL